MKYGLVLWAAALFGGAGTAHAANWTVDDSKSSIVFTGTQTGQKFTGSFTKFSSIVNFDPPHASGNVLIVIATASAKTGDTQRDEALPGADWFNQPVFPEAKFAAKTFKANGGNNYEADGTLTIRGISKPVVLPFSFSESGNTATVTGQLTLRRTDYGVGQGDWASGEYVGLDVTVMINLVAVEK